MSKTGPTLAMKMERQDAYRSTWKSVITTSGGLGISSKKWGV